MLAGIEISSWEGQTPRDWARLWRVPELHILDRTRSTNDVAKQLAEHGAPAGTTVLAEEQTAGRGRLGRPWHAPYGSAILASIVLRPPPHRSSIRIPTTIPIRIGVAVARAIESVADIAISLKWPNDVIVPRIGKVAGILCEGALGDATPEFVIAGIGINVNQTAEQLVAGGGPEAASLAMIAGQPLSRAELAGALLHEILPGANAAGEPLDATTLLEYGRRDLLIGGAITVDDNYTGTAAGITPDGALTLIGPDGRRTIRGGTIRLAGGSSGNGYPRAPATPRGQRSTANRRQGTAGDAHGEVG
jgi:BirA family biotin operon repressor/biotin-[acetyl-CoA-carboxylase] ligase